MIYSFPIAFAINTFSMTGLMVLLGILGRLSLAAEFGIVHGATAALFLAFSANARNLILNVKSKISIESLVFSRLLLIVPLGIACFFLSISVPQVSWILALLLIIRRCTEWLSELHLSYLESEHLFSFANLFSAFQTILFFFAFVWMYLFDDLYWLGLLFWAFCPLALHLKFIYKHIRHGKNVYRSYRFFLPHFGSTAIIGISVYIFRLFILFLAGKSLAGELYSAYAIGGLLCSFFIYALGPSLVFQEERENKSQFPMSFKLMIGSMFVLGSTIFLLAYLKIDLIHSLGHSYIFWATIGLSMIGGGIKIFGERIRIKILQTHGKEDVFGPDMVIGLLFLVFVPFSIHFVGKEIFQYLFLISSVTTFFIYTILHHRITVNRLSDVVYENKRYFYLASFIFVFPLFFQLSGTIFNDPSYVFDTGGQFRRLPIPISVFACIGGLLFISNYTRSKDVLYMIFSFFLLMTTATVITTHNQVDNQRDKLILLIQFLSPLFAMITGRMFEPFELASKDRKIFEKTVIIVLLIVIPLQLYNTWLDSFLILSPRMFFFSIYQHLQYVPTILICCYIFTLFSFYKNKKYFFALSCMAPIVGVYTALSLSMLTALVLIGGISIFSFTNLKRKAEMKPVILYVTVLITLVLTIYNYRHNEYILQGRSFDKSQLSKSNAEAKSNFQESLEIWKYYSKNIFSSPKSFLFGLPERPKRETHPSAHNYYLDLAHNFGVVSLIPLFLMVIKLIKKIYRLRIEIYNKTNIIGLIFVVLFLLLIDNMFKVGMRQPYPGIITFFLWGLLLSRLDCYCFAKNKKIEKHK